MRAVLPCLYSAVMMAVAISALRRKTVRKMEKASRLTAPEIALIAVLADVAIFQDMLCITELAFIGPKGEAAGIMMLRGMMALGVQHLFVATGIAAVLLLAGALAEQLRGLDGGG